MVFLAKQHYTSISDRCQTLFFIRIACGYASIFNPPPVYFAIIDRFPRAGMNLLLRLTCVPSVFSCIYNRIWCRAYCLIILTIFAIIMAMIYGTKYQGWNWGAGKRACKLAGERYIKHYYRQRDKWRIYKRRFNASTFAKRARWPLIIQFNTRVDSGSRSCTRNSVSCTFERFSRSSSRQWRAHFNCRSLVLSSNKTAHALSLTFNFIITTERKKEKKREKRGKKEGHPTSSLIRLLWSHPLSRSFRTYPH